MHHKLPITYFLVSSILFSCESFEQKINFIETQDDSPFVELSINQFDSITLNQNAFGGTLFPEKNAELSFQFSSDELEKVFDISFKFSDSESEQFSDDVTSQEIVDIIHIGKWSPFNPSLNGRTISIYYFDWRTEKSYYNSYFLDGKHLNSFNINNSSFQLNEVILESSQSYLSNFDLIEAVRIKGTFDQVLYAVGNPTDSLTFEGSFDGFLHPL